MWTGSLRAGASCAIGQLVLVWVLGPFAGSLDPSIGVDFSSYYPRSWILLGPEAVDLCDLCHRW